MPFAFEPAALVIGLREGLEAFVVLGIVVGMLRRFGRPEKGRAALVGALVGLLASALIALVLDQAFQRYIGNALFEAIVGVAALAILVYMIVWMQRHTAQMTGRMHDRVRLAADQGKWAVIASLGFVIVFREGVETVAFFAARSAEGVSWATLGVSGLLGFALAAVAALGIFRLSLRVNLRRFFAVTGVLLILVSAALLVSTVHEAEDFSQERLHVAPTPLLWDLRGSFPYEDQDCVGGAVAGNGTCVGGHHVTADPVAGALHVFIGYSDHPTALQGLAWLAWVAGFGGWYARSLRPRRAAAA
jgi:high-affinity iron transporter